MLASAGDDGNTLIWVPSETHSNTPAYGEDALEDKETWRIKHMCRSSGSEIYDLAWSPDGIFFITGSMDNIARIYNAQSGQYKAPHPSFRQRRDLPHFVSAHDRPLPKEDMNGVLPEYEANGGLTSSQDRWYGR